MSERLNIAFSEEGAPYAMLALKDTTLETPAMAQWLTALANIVHDYSLDEESNISSLAAKIVATLASQPGTGADLLPGNSSWLADLTVNVRCVDGEVTVACKQRDFSALGIQFDDDELGSLDALDGFEGTAEGFKALVDGVQWESQSPE